MQTRRRRAGFILFVGFLVSYDLLVVVTGIPRRMSRCSSRYSVQTDSCLKEHTRRVIRGASAGVFRHVLLSHAHTLETNTLEHTETLPHQEPYHAVG